MHNTNSNFANHLNFENNSFIEFCVSLLNNLPVRDSGLRERLSTGKDNCAVPLLSTPRPVPPHPSTSTGEPYPQAMRDMVFQLIANGTINSPHIQQLQQQHLFPSASTVRRWINQYNTIGHNHPTGLATQKLQLQKLMYFCSTQTLATRHFASTVHRRCQRQKIYWI